MRSKETERAVDWEDIAILEEFHDARLLAQAGSGDEPLVHALSSIRSRSGFDAALHKGMLSREPLTEQALNAAKLAVTQAFLLPFASAATSPPATSPAIEPVIRSRLQRVSPASPLHLTLVEAVRRQYRLVAQAVDRADKEADIRSQRG
jgi:hypothetical protein